VATTPTDGNRLDRPHHDGSAHHVETAAPTLGDDVAVWLRVPAAAGVDEVHVRSTPDGEPGFAEAVADRVDAVTGDTWWRAEVTARNEVTRYRWLVDGPGGPRWVTQSGVVAREVADTHDFRLVTHAPAPAWVTDAVLYQVFPDRFATTGVAARLGVPPPLQIVDWDEPVQGDGPGAMHQLYGGDLPGVEAHLDHLVELGVTGLYLNPIFPAPENHRYCASSFDEVDPLLGGDAALASLSAAAHARGLRLLGDLTANHTGSLHPWFKAAQGSTDAVEHDFYYWQRWPDEYDTWAGVASLPKLNHRSPELRRRLVEGPDSVVGRWLRPPFDLDGWRVDAANMAGRHGRDDLTHELARAVRHTAVALRPDAYVLAEHCHDFSGDLDCGGWHGTMNYTGFTAPVWSWLRDPAVAVSLLGLPTGVPVRGGRANAATVDDVNGLVSWQSRTASLTLLGSHDTTRLATVIADPAMRRIAIGLLLTFPGVPSVLYGDELGMRSEHRAESGRRPMRWDRTTWDLDLLGWWRRLVHLRRDHVALRRGGFRWAWVDEDTWVFVREAAGESVLVAARRSGASAAVLPGAALGLHPGGAPAPSLLDGSDLAADSAGRVRLPGDGRRLDAWLLEG